jgi:hypothetical protein
MFYPGAADTLAAEVERLVAAAAPTEVAQAPKLLVVPHAGYIYSGPIAAQAYALLARWRAQVRRVVLLGPAHRLAIRGLALPSVSAFETPLGRVELDRAALAQLRGLAQVSVNDAVHAKEHSIEVQVPFAQKLFPNAAIVAAVVATENPRVAERFGKALAKALTGRQALIVASTDLSHYPPWRDANTADRRTLEAMATLDADRLRTATSAADPNSSRLATCACGEGAVLAAIAAAKAMGATRGQVVSYANSGDVPAGDPERVVGYGAVAFTGGQAGADTSVLVPASASVQALPPTAADKKRMLALARETIRRYLDTQTVPLPRGFSPALDRPQGVFVTLKKRGELRGCIGQMQPDRPLRVLTGSMALAAAFEDPRFNKVRANELKDLEIEISVLTPFKEVPGPSAIVVGRDGVLLQKDRRSAVFLPQVAVEEHWTREEMLDNLCVKGGLPEACWRTGAKFWTFQADVFKE